MELYPKLISMSFAEIHWSFAISSSIKALFSFWNTLTFQPHKLFYGARLGSWSKKIFSQNSLFGFLCFTLDDSLLYSRYLLSTGILERTTAYLYITVLCGNDYIPYPIASMVLPYLEKIIFKHMTGKNKKIPWNRHTSLNKKDYFGNSFGHQWS